MPGIFNLIDASLKLQERFETISNNLANTGTNAFKKDIVSFKETFAGSKDNSAFTGSKDSVTDFSPGPIRHTGNQLDVALMNNGFFKIQTPRGMRYTRDGSFTLNSEGELLTKNGDTVLGQNGPVKINGSKVSIRSDGQIVVDKEPVEKLLVVDFEQTKFLTKEGGSYYLYSGEEKEIYTVDNVNIQQNYIESSNVNSIQESIKMIETFRVFQSVQKAIQSIDQINNKMINEYGTTQ
jgi:flagellar basal-body rod protein FlgG